jgi:hypothetical protein
MNAPESREAQAEFVGRLGGNIVDQFQMFMVELSADPDTPDRLRAWLDGNAVIVLSAERIAVLPLPLIIAARGGSEPFIDEDPDGYDEDDGHPGTYL